MRILPALLSVFLTVLTGRLSAQSNNDPIILTGTMPSQTITGATGAVGLDLRNYFAVPTITQQVVQFTVPGAGVFNVEMDAARAPLTVANFLAYVRAGSFTNALLHRSIPGVIQGGSFYPNATGTDFTSYTGVATGAQIAMETADTLENTAGTIAMARTSDLNSATSGWFINVVDHSGFYKKASANDPGDGGITSAGSYAVFGRVKGTGMTVVNTLANLPVLGGNVSVITSATTSAFVTIDAASAPANFGMGWSLLGSYVQAYTGNFVTLAASASTNISTPTAAVVALFGSPFDNLPVLHNLASSSGPVPLTELVKTSSVTPIPLFPTTSSSTAVVTFTVQNTNPSIVSATLFGSTLRLGPAANLSGSSTITVTASDSNGNPVSQNSFPVTMTRKVVDFNGDGFADLSFQNAVGQLSAWRLDGTGNAVNFTTGSGVRPGSGLLYGGGLGDWKLVASADLNGDGFPDLLFQNAVGQLSVWFLDGTGNTIDFSTGSGVRPGSGLLYGSALGDWRVVACADINGDGFPDLIFQNAVGQISVWFLDGSGSAINFGTGTGVKPGSGLLFASGLGDWRVVGSADINGDGIADLLFQNAAGQVSVWYLDGSGSTVNFATGSGVRPGSGLLYSMPLGDWRLVKVGDFNGDGFPDLLFQNTVGQISIWYLDGSGAAINFTTGAGLKPGSHLLYSAGLGDWRVR